MEQDQREQDRREEAPAADEWAVDAPTTDMPALDPAGTDARLEGAGDPPSPGEMAWPTTEPAPQFPAEPAPVPDLMGESPTLPMESPALQSPAAAGPLMPWSPDLPAQPVRAARPRPAAPPRGWRPVALGAALAALLLSALLVGVRGATLAFSRPPGPAPTVTAAASPTPTATPDPRIAHNAALGCAPDAPAPQPDVIQGGNYRGATEPAPKEVALTFDDGPTPESTPYILDILERTHTPATFFVEGQYVTRWPDLLRREWDDGFAIANHSWDHPLMAHLTPDQLDHQFGDTNRAIHDVLGPDACLWLYRPPYANFNTLVIQKAQQYGLTSIVWDDGSNDWALPRPSPQTLASNVLTRLHPGAVILFHDGPARHPNTEAALPLVLQGLLARGYLPVTLPRLLADAHYPGVTVEGPPPPPPTLPADLLVPPGPTAPAAAPSQAAPGDPAE